MSAAAVINAEELQTKALTHVERAKAITVTDQVTYDTACQMAIGLVALRDEVIAHHAEPKQKAHEAHKAICAAEKKMLQPIDDALALLRPAIAAWSAEQKRLEEQRRREEEQRLLAEAEEQIEAEAVMAEAEGASLEEVAAIIETPVTIPAVRIQPTYQRAAGVSTATRWGCKVTDVKKLCGAIFNGIASTELVMKLDRNKEDGRLTSPALELLARAQKRTFNIPGCVAVELNNVRFSSGRR